MLNKAIKELMSQRGLNQKSLSVALGQSESTFSRMFMNENSDPKQSSIELLARRLNVKVSEIYLEKESLEPVICRYFYSKKQDLLPSSLGEKSSSKEVYINGGWVNYSETTSSTGSSNWDDVIYLGEAPEWHIRINGRIQCPELYKRLCDEARVK